MLSPCVVGHTYLYSSDLEMDDVLCVGRVRDRQLTCVDTWRCYSTQAFDSAAKQSGSVAPFNRARTATSCPNFVSGTSCGTPYFNTTDTYNCYTVTLFF